MESTKIPFELVKEFSGVAVYKINKQNLLCFNTVKNNQINQEKEFFYNCIKKNKYLGINLTEEIKELYIENNVIDERY